MRAFTLLLAAIVLIELVVGSFLMNPSSPSPPAPVPNLATINSSTGEAFQALANETKTAEDFHLLGTVYMANGFFSEATAALKQAVKMDPKSDKYVFDYAFCLSRTGHLEEANRQFEKAIELGHARPDEAMFYVGRNQLRAEDPEKAAAAFRSSITLPLSKYELAKILYRQDKLDESEQFVQEAFAQEPASIEPQILLSRIADKKGDKKAAIKYSFDGANRSAPISSPFQQERERLYSTYSTIGYGKELNQIYRRLDNQQNSAALTALKKLIEVKWDYETIDALIQVSKLQGQESEAINYIKQRFAHYGLSSQWLFELGQIQMSQGNRLDAVKSWKRGVELNSDTYASECCVSLSEYFRESGDAEQSKKYKAIGSMFMARNAINRGQMQEAKGLADSAVNLSRDSAEAHYLLGEAHLYGGSGDESKENAIEAFKKCVDLDPMHGRALRRLKSLED